MLRPAARFCLIPVSAALLAGFFMLAGFLTSAARADGPALTAKFGIAGRYRPGGWCLVTIGVQNPGMDTLSGQLQVLTAGDSGRSPYGRQPRQNSSSVVFACPVSVPGGSVAPHFFPLYLRGVDPGQADVTVQLVEGRERGDGRVLATISNQDQNTATAFSGGPVGTNDTLLAGFGGVPGTFTFLNSRPFLSTPAMRNKFGVSTGTPATLQVAEAATAADLPDRAAGYDGISAFLLQSDAPVESLTESQAAALRGWVAAGGHLIVCGGPDPTRFGSAFYDGLLPATVGPSSSAGALTLSPKPLPGVRILQPGLGGQAQSVIGPYGAGTVTVTAFDPTSKAFQTAKAFQSAGLSLPPVWQTLLLSQPAPAASVLAATASREENFDAIYYGTAPPLLSQAVMRGPSLDAPGTSVIAIFLLLYLIVLVPVNYFVLKRMDRKELAWLTIPALVFLFAAGTFAVGYAAKGGSVFVNRAALVETQAGQSQAGIYSEIGLFSPHRTTYDISLPGDNLLAAVPNPGVNYGSGDNLQGSGPAQFVEIPGGVTLPNTPVNMWAMRAFDAQSSTDLGGAIDGALADKIGAVKGSLSNHTPYALTGCAVLYGGRWLPIGTLSPGATVTLSPENSLGAPSPSFLVPSPADDAQASIHDRIQAALGDYFRSLSQSIPNYSNGASSPQIYSPAPDEALLAGWSSDPKLAGPAPRVDGRAVTVNDVSLVLVHLPVSGPLAYSRIVAQTAPLTGPMPQFAFMVSRFKDITRSSLSYKQAVDIRTFGVAAASKRLGQMVRLRGIVSKVDHNPSFRSTVLDFEPDGSERGVVAVLRFSPGRQDPGVQSLLRKEVVITGTLTRVQAPTEVIVEQATQLQVVQ